MMLEDLCSVSSSPSLDSFPGALYKAGSPAETLQNHIGNETGQPRILRDDYNTSSSSSSSGSSALLDLSENHLDVFQALPAQLQLKENQQPSYTAALNQPGAGIVSLGKHSSQDAADRASLMARWASQDSAQAVLDVAYATERALQELELELQLQGPATPMVRCPTYLQLRSRYFMHFPSLQLMEPSIGAI